MLRAPSRLTAAALGFTTAVLATASIGVAAASGTHTPAAASTVSAGRGLNGFGKTDDFLNGKTVTLTYTKGFYCDTHVHSYAATGCEVGTAAKRPPATHYDPLFITVPLGFTVPAMAMECPDGLVCVDHPATLDLTRLEKALKPLYPGLSDAQLTAALKNYTTPGHDHFLIDNNNRKAEWWDVKVVGVTSRTVFNAIHAHRSYAYLNSLIKAKNKNVVGPIPSNLFLFFAAS